WPYAFAACLPWAVLVPAMAIGRQAQSTAPDAQQKSWQRYLWMWALAPCLFFTASRNIIWTYFLPGMPALAMLAAAWLARDSSPTRVDRLLAGGLLFALLAFGAALSVMQVQQSFRSAKPVIAAVDRLHADRATLVFVGHGIYTPAFYSQGRAVQLRDTAQLDAVLNDAPAGKAPRFVALYGSQWRELSAPLQARLRPEGRFGTYDLYTVLP
ncbi:MAG: hypothetical protein ACJ8GW_11540, partial [Massilia sp.]